MDDARVLLLRGEHGWQWPEAVVHPSVLEDIGPASLLHRATALLRHHFALAPHACLVELLRSHREHGVAGFSLEAYFHCHVTPAPGVTIPFEGTDAAWLTLDELLDTSSDPRPGILAFSRLAAIGARTLAAAASRLSTGGPR